MWKHVWKVEPFGITYRSSWLLSRTKRVDRKTATVNKNVLHIYLQFWTSSLYWCCDLPPACFSLSANLSGLLNVSVHDHWWSHPVRNVQFPPWLMALQTLFGELGKGHIAFNLQRFWVFKLEGWTDLQTPPEPPLFYFHCLFYCSFTRIPQWSSDLYSGAPLQVSVQQRTAGSLWSLSSLTLNNFPFI